MLLLDFCSGSANIWRLVGKVINIFMIVTPILIVLFGTIDLGKAVLASDEKEIKVAQKMFIKRLIYGVVIFFVITITKTVIGLINTNVVSDNNICWVCAVDPEGDKCKKASVQAICALDPTNKICKN